MVSVYTKNVRVRPIDDLPIGLKYHITHGSCNFAPPKDLEHVQALLERKRKEKEKAAAGGDDSEPGTPLRLSPTSTSHPPTAPGSAANSAPSSALQSPSLDGNMQLPSPSHTNFPHSSQPNSPHPLSQSSVSGQASGNSLLLSDLSLLGESDLREIERETEKRVRPFACTVGDCPRRYKNMNGLRYHYQHSGEHGAVGLAMLASGVHECLQQNGSTNQHHHGPGHRERRRLKAESRGASRAGTPPVPQQQVPTSTAILQQGQAQQQAQAQNQQHVFAHLAYQQQFAEHQRAQYAAQQAAAQLTS
jgi:transcription factor SFP1